MIIVNQIFLGIAIGFSIRILIDYLLKSVISNFKNPPLLPKKRKCVGIVMGRKLYRDDHS